MAMSLRALQIMIVRHNRQCRLDAFMERVTTWGTTATMGGGILSLVASSTFPVEVGIAAAFSLWWTAYRLRKINVVDDDLLAWRKKHGIGWDQVLPHVGSTSDSLYRFCQSPKNKKEDI